MKKIAFLSLFFVSAVATASGFDPNTMCKDRYPHLCQNTITYNCAGPGVSGVVRITPLDKDTVNAGTAGIAYSAVSKFNVNGKVYSLKGSGRAKYVRNYLDSYGTWEPNFERWLYNLFGAQADFNRSGKPMYLEVRNGGAGGVKGYLSYWASAPPTRGQSDLNFTCNMSR